LFHLTQDSDLLYIGIQFFFQRKCFYQNLLGISKSSYNRAKSLRKDNVKKLEYHRHCKAYNKPSKSKYVDSPFAFPSISSFNKFIENNNSYFFLVLWIIAYMEVFLKKNAENDPTGILNITSMNVFIHYNIFSALLKIFYLYCLF